MNYVILFIFLLGWPLGKDGTAEDFGAMSFDIGLF